jgi:hypothetical protein
MASKLSKTTTDHEEIQRWAEARGAKPAEVEGTERSADDTGIIRLDFPGYAGTPPLKHIPWEEWFEKFDRENLALVYQEKTSGGQKSNFNKLIARETAQARSRGDAKASRRSLRGKRGAGARRAAPSRRGAAAKESARRRPAAKKAGASRSASRTGKDRKTASSGARRSTRAGATARPGRVEVRVPGLPRMIGRLEIEPEKGKRGGAKAGRAGARKGSGAAKKRSGGRGRTGRR